MLEFGHCTRHKLWPVCYGDYAAWVYCTEMKRPETTRNDTFSNGLRLSHDGKKQLENKHRCFQLSQSATTVQDATKQQTNWNHKTWEQSKFGLERLRLQFRKEHIVLTSKSIWTLFELFLIHVILHTFANILWGCCTARSKVTFYQQPLPSVNKLLWAPENLQQRGTARASELSQAQTPCLRRTEWSDQHIGNVDICKSNVWRLRKPFDYKLINQKYYFWSDHLRFPVGFSACLCCHIWAENNQ